MGKKYLALFLAAFMLLGQIAGTGPFVYAAEPGEEQEGTEGAVYEPHFGFGDEIRLLPGWEYDIYTKDSGVWYVRDEAHSVDQNFNMEITDVGLTCEDGSVTIEKMDEGWKLVAAEDRLGEAKIKVTARIAEEEGYVSPDYAEKVETAVVDVIVCDKIYNLGVGTDTGTDNLLPGDSIRMYADVSLECWNESEGNYLGDASDVSIEWNIDSERAWGEVIDGGRGFEVHASDTEDGEEYDIPVSVRLMAGDEEVARDDHPLYVRNQYYVLEPIELEGAENLWPGDEPISVVPEVYFYEKGEERAKQENVQYQFDYNMDNFSVKKDGAEVDSQGQESDGTFTIQRLQNSDDRVRIEAYIQGEDGAQWCCDREWWFHWQDYNNIWFEGCREDNYSWIFVDDNDPEENDGEEARTFKLNTENLKGNYTVEWMVGIGEEEDPEGNYVQTAGENTYTQTEDGIIIKAVEMKKDIREKLNMDADDESNVGFHLRAIVKDPSGEELSRRDMWVDIRTPEYQLEDDDDGDVLFGAEFVYENGEIGCYVTNKDYPYGEDLRLKITNLELMEQYQEEEAFVKSLDGENIHLSAQNYGGTKLGYTVKLPSGREKTFIRDKWVSSDIYRLNVWSSTGTTCLLPEGELKLETEVWHGHYNESTKEREWEMLEPGDYIVNYENYDSNLISVDENGNVKAQTERGDTNVNVVLLVPRQGEEEYRRDSWFPIFVVDCYYLASAEDVTAGPGETVGSIVWKMERVDLENRDGTPETESVSYRLEPTEGIQLNEEKKGFTVDSDVPDGEKIEIGLIAEKENEHGLVIGEAGTSFMLTVCQHDFKEAAGTLKPATCTEAGSRVLECQKCHSRKTEEIPMLGHKAGEWKITKQASCTETGMREQKCTVCQAVMKRETIAAAGHKAGAWTTVKQPSCTAAGTQEQVCSICHTVMDTKTVPATGHSFGEWKETAKPTALKQGTKTRTCKICSAAETQKTDKLKATIKLNVKKIPLQVKKSTTAVKVTSMTKGDSVKSWKSSNKKVATVTSKGKITGKKTGTAKITVTLKSGISASVTVKVQKKAVTTTKLSVTGKSVKKNKLTLKKGKSVTLVVTKTPITSTEKVTYKSSDKKIAVVSGKGKITAKKPGKAKITVTSGKKKVQITVTVKK